MPASDTRLRTVLHGYTKFLQEKKLAIPKHQPYLVQPVREFLLFARQHAGYSFEQTLELFLAELGRRPAVQPWQVRQAADAVRVYRYQFRGAEKGPKNAGRDEVKIVNAEDMVRRLREVIRLRHYARSTEKAYLHWTNRFLTYRRQTGVTEENGGRKTGRVRYWQDGKGRIRHRYPTSSLRFRANWKRLVSTLVHVAKSHVMPVFLPPPHMRDRQTLHELRQVAVMLRPKKEMPVVGEHAIRTNPHRRLLQRLVQGPLERLVISGLLEHLHPRNASVENVEHHSPRSYSCGARHGPKSTILAYFVNIGPVPFCVRTSRRIVAAGVPGVAAGDAKESSPRALECSVFADRFDEVGAARGVEAAVLAEHGADEPLVGRGQPNKGDLRQASQSVQNYSKRDHRLCPCSFRSIRWASEPSER